jgi:hypothetical protein
MCGISVSSRPCPLPFGGSRRVSKLAEEQASHGDVDVTCGDAQLFDARWRTRAVAEVSGVPWIGVVDPVSLVLLSLSWLVDCRSSGPVWF